MPTRLAVLLQSRKSAAAGPAETNSANATTAPKTSAPAAVLVKIPRLISGADSASNRWSVNDNGAEVGDVGERRAGREQIADAVEKPRGIVVGEKRGGNEAGRFGPRQAGIVDKGAGRVVRLAPAAVGSVGVGGKRRDALGAIEVKGQRQRVFLIGAAAAAALERHRQFAAGEDDD